MRATISIPPHLAHGEDGAPPATPGAPDVQVAVAGPEYGGVQALVPLLALRENTNHGPSLRELGGRSL